MNFTKNEAVILTLISCALMAFGHLTEGVLSYVAVSIGGLIIGLTLNADTASETPDNLKD